jgi:gliding motility-associated-like protein
MEERDLFNDLLKNKLDNLDSPVRADIWSSVSSSISTSSAAVGAGLSVLTKIAIGVSVVAATVTGVLFYSVDKHQQETETIDTPKQPKESLKEQTIRKEFKEITYKENVENLPVLTENKTEINLNTNIENNNPQVITENIIENKTDQNVEKPVEISPLPIVSNGPLTVNQLPSNEEIQLPKSSTIELILPNIITPNRDGVNDVLSVDISKLSEASVVILNNKGQVVYVMKGTEFSWDGSDKNGDLVPAGSYIYFITGLDKNGLTYKKYSKLEINY